MRNQEAIVLDEKGLSVEGKKIAKLLGFFGAPWRASTTTELLALNGTGTESPPNCRLLCSSGAFLRVIESWERNPRWIRFWGDHVHSAFVYGGDDSESLQNLLRRLSGDERAEVCQIDASVREVIVSEQLDDFCGAMAGVRAAASRTNTDLVSNVSNGNSITIISRGAGAAFLKVEYKGVAVFLSTSKEIIDIDAELTSQNFDIRQYFLSAVPIVLYVKWAFARTCWSAPEINACLVIDDPVLKSTHGFVNFQELLSLMKRYNFTSNIAFIPWNWRRSTPEVIRLFRENPENYSLSVHGCDHTRGEFGSSDRQRLYWKAQQGLERMRRHEAITGIQHDRVMVFPQGIFSAAAISALKRTDLIAAVNNDIISVDGHRRQITLSELWDVAVMRYDTFPIFTRRYPWEGIENFAFDALLGKPAIMVIHHDYCSDHCARLIRIIERLNALKCDLTWRSLGEIVTRSCRQRELSSERVEIEMYAAALRIENRFGQRKSFLIRRRESEPSAIREIFDGFGPIAWNSANGYVHCKIELSSGDSKTIGIRFNELGENRFNGDSLPYRFKAMLRRYLCELRDNYVTMARLRLAGLVK